MTSDTKCLDALICFLFRHPSESVAQTSGFGGGGFPAPPELFLEAGEVFANLKFKLPNIKALSESVRRASKVSNLYRPSCQKWNFILGRGQMALLGIAPFRNQQALTRATVSQYQIH